MEASPGRAERPGGAGRDERGFKGDVRQKPRLAQGRLQAHVRRGVERADHLRRGRRAMRERIDPPPDAEEIPRLRPAVEVQPQGGRRVPVRHQGRLSQGEDGFFHSPLKVLKPHNYNHYHK